MVPCIDDSIPVYVRNSFNPAFEGTVVQGRSPTLKETAMSGSTQNWRAKKVSSSTFEDNDILLMTSHFLTQFLGSLIRGLSLSKVLPLLIKLPLLPWKELPLFGDQMLPKSSWELWQIMISMFSSSHKLAAHRPSVLPYQKMKEKRRLLLFNLPLN